MSPSARNFRTRIARQNRYTNPLHTASAERSHTFALRWFAVGKLASASRLQHLSEDETRDFRAQFGDTWHLVQTMLGHRSVETTKNVYLNSQELHQPGEKPQVSRSQDCGNSVPAVLMPAL
jgi:integrase